MKNIEVTKLCAYVVIGVALLIQPCESITYLNRTNITLQNGGNIDRFSFSFRTCSTGVILREGTNNLTLSIIAGNETQHSFLRLSWENNNSPYALNLKQYISIDSNVMIKVEVIKQLNNSIFAITNSDVVNPVKKYSTSPSILDNLMLSGNFILGSDTFSGCFSSGTNIDINSFANTLCTLSNLLPCDPKAACPRGFTGRYCQDNIDECALNNSPKCHSFSKCVDLIDGFKCICGPQWNGTYCDNLKGDLCDTTTPCQNGGQCTTATDKNNYTCTCLPYTSGRNCQHADYCSPSRCKNGGICLGNSTGFIGCQCLPGTSGMYCANKIDPCAVFPCNRGECTDLGNGNFTCNCSNTGLYGDKCQNNINECHHSPCKNNATCEDKWGSYLCKCFAGYDGTDCENDIDDCLSNPCGSRGNCTDKVNAFECKCDPGFNGSLCRNNINDCRPDSCHPTQSNPCVDGINSYTCPCKPGYNGSTCATEINECESNPCKNGAQCVDLLASYNCICLPGFTGDNCSININECATNPCGAHGRCVDEINKYTCICEAGYIGDNCETNEDNCVPNPCLHYGVCKDEVDNYTCSCIPSYIGRNCSTFRDPCAPNNNLCQNGNCTVHETKGFVCDCPNEYDGDLCQHRYSACYPNPCIHGNCSVDGSTYNCSCNKGYAGRNCTIDIDECASNPCKNGGTCTDGIGTYICRCPRDRLLPNCEVFIYQCPQYKASHNEDYCTHGTCIELGNLEMRCDCTPGYEGTRCNVDINECSHGFCQHNSNCTDLVNGYHCACVPGYTNKNCSVEINECDPDPCKNGATCRDLLNDYECDCKFGYEGKNCSIDIDWCERLSPCVHGATCHDGIDTYTCDCLPGFLGKNCSYDVDECTPNPCIYHDVQNNKLHESTCVQKSNLTAMRQSGFSVNGSTFENRGGYVCVCIDGLNGTNCSHNIENCSSTTCVNNATCTDGIDDFYCHCKAGYTGKRCEIDIDECEGHPCQNNATCTDLVNDYNCTCPPNFAGRNCSVILSNCSEHNPCQKNTTASCYFDGSSVTCTCAKGYTGVLCTDETNINLNGLGYWKLSDEDLNTNNNTNRFTLTLSFATTLRSGSILYISFIGGSSLNVYIDNSLVVLMIGGSRFVGSSNQDQFNSGKWHTMLIDMMEANGSFKFNNGTTHSHALFKYMRIESVYIGGFPGQIQMVNYTGCIRDIRIGDKTLIPSSGLVGNVVSGYCRRTPVCNETSCSHGNGTCIDKWLTSECDCATQYFGKDCESEIVSFSFGEVAKFARNTTRSRSRRSAPTVAYAFSNVNGTFAKNSEFTFRIRTRQSNNLVAVLVNQDKSSSYLALYVNKSKLSFRTSGLAGSSQGVLLPSGLSDGIWHEIILSTGNVSDNGKKTEVFLPSFNVSGIYIGGVDPAVLSDSTIYSDVIFDGCLQAVKLKGTVLTSQPVPGQPSVNTTTKGKVKYGCPSNNPCAASPCGTFGNCTDKWFAHFCSCRPGFYGKSCSVYGCALANSSHPCRNKLNCVDVPTSPGRTICSQSFTFNGVNSTASLKLKNLTLKRLSFAIQTRQRETFLFASYESPSRYFAVGIKDGLLSLNANYSGTVISLQGSVSVNDGARHDIDVKDINGNTSLTDASSSVITKTFSESIINDAWLGLLSNSTLVIGVDNSNFIKTLFSGFYFGAFTLKQVGQLTPVKSDFNYTDVSVGWQSSNPCKHSPCKNNGQCNDTFNDYHCACPKFYTKKDCNETVDITCSFGSVCNNGTCEDLNGTMVSNITTGQKLSDNGKDGFKCNCHPGFTGYLCGDVTDECAANPCKNNGTCVDRHLDYYCRCSPGWEGNNCSVNIDECVPDPCKNNGTCVDDINDYQCLCFKGRYKGKNCSEDEDECTGTNPCNNRGNCTNRLHGYDCACNNGSFGDKCQYNNTEYCAHASPCNHGSCSTVGLIDTYICICDPAYTGVLCDQDYDECAAWKPCKNNGSCQQTLDNNRYKCNCTDAFTGLNCTTEKDPCDPNPCLHGNCTKGVYPAYKCNCFSGYVGSQCNAAANTGSKSSDSTVVIVVCVVVVVVVIIIAIILFICYYKKNSGQSGTYNPGEIETKTGVEKEMDEIKKPKVERLI